MNLAGQNLPASVYRTLFAVREINPFLTEEVINATVKELGQVLIDRIEELYGVLECPD